MGWSCRSWQEDKGPLQPLTALCPCIPELPAPAHRTQAAQKMEQWPRPVRYFSAAELIGAESMPCLMNALCNLGVAPRRFSRLLCSAVGSINVCGGGDFSIFSSPFHQNGSCALGQKPASNSRSFGCSVQWCCAILRSLAAGNEGLEGLRSMMYRA